jgi:putative N6-adenine-specific DNA methylase
MQVHSLYRSRCRPLSVWKSITSSNSLSTRKTIEDTRSSQFHTSLIANSRSNETNADLEYYRRQMTGTKQESRIEKKGRGRTGNSGNRKDANYGKSKSGPEGKTLAKFDTHVQMEKDQDGRNFRQKGPTNARAALDPTPRHSKPEMAGDGPFKFPPSHLDVFISCLPGLESILSAEMKALEIDHKTEAGGVHLINPTTEDIMECHLFLGTASNVLLRCGDPFVVRGLPELRRKISKLPWRRILKRNVRLEARVTSSKSKLYHTTAIRDRILGGIYEALGYEVPDDGQRFEPPEVEGDTVVKLDVRLIRDNISISIDTSQTPIHQRGYRLQTAKAPLREDLAYAMLWSAGWKPRHHEDLDEDELAKDTWVFKGLLDPLCGSGTIAIEGAAIAAGLPPGRLRPAPLEGTRLQNEGKWKKLVTGTASGRISKKALGKKKIAASDRDAGAVEIAKSNAKRAGVLQLIDFDECALAAQPWFENPESAPRDLLLASNPPFGKRISAPTKHSSEETQLLPLFQTLGSRVKRLIETGRGVGTILLSNNPAMLRRTGIDRVGLAFKSLHGGMPVSAMSSYTAQKEAVSEKKK